MRSKCGCGRARIGPWRRGAGWCSICWRLMNDGRNSSDPSCCGGKAVDWSVEMARPIKWACGLTTVPQRKGDLLPQTLISLRAAGFDPRLFVDGAPGGWDEFGLPVTYRFPGVRAFGNFILGLAELYIREPGADRYAMFQDDFVTYKNLRPYLDTCQYPSSGYWNLYTFPENQALAPAGSTGWFKSNQRGRGAVALIFSREAVQVLLASREHIIDRPTHINGHKSLDGGVLSAMRKAGWEEYCHNPTLVQHTGFNSIIANRTRPDRWKAVSFRGEGFDALELGKR